MHKTETDILSGVQRRDAALIAALMITDSLFFVFARLLQPHITPDLSVMYVMFIGAIEVGIIALVNKHLSIHTLLKNLWFFLAIGLLVSASTYLNYTAVAFIDPGTASLLSQATLVFGLLLGLTWLREKLTLAQMGGAVLSILGVLVITFRVGDYFRLGSLMILGSAFAYAVHAALVKKYAGQIYFYEFFFFRLLCTGGFMLVFNLSRGAITLPVKSAWPLLLLVGTVDLTIGRSLYYLVLRRLMISTFSVLLTLSPLVTILWSYALFGDVPG
ncbi:MAG: DMT family transporter, partial [Anaerolineaceae bacterium]|nr:DMT family transporter [Anaerolineaceae bacterium]